MLEYICDVFTVDAIDTNMETYTSPLCPYVLRGVGIKGSLYEKRSLKYLSLNVK